MSDLLTAHEPIAVLSRYPLTERGWWVQLEQWERQRAWEVAERRDRHALAANANPEKNAVEGLGHNDLVEMSTRERNYVGCLGEQAVAKRLDVAWTGATTSWADDDDVSGIQVRSTFYANGALRTWATDEKVPHILAVVYRDGVVRLAGWALAGEGREWNGATFTPQRDLRHMEMFVVPPCLERYS